MTHSRRSEEGQILALFAVAMVGLLGALALVLDGGTLYVQRRYAQTAADAAALAGTRLLTTATPTTPLTEFQAIINTYVGSNAFGVTGEVRCAYFVQTDGVTPAGNITGTSGCARYPNAVVPATPCTSPPSASVPCNAAGVAVHVKVGPYSTYLMAVVPGGAAQTQVEAHATAQVGSLTGMDSDLAPIALCGDDQPRVGDQPNADIVLGTNPGPYTVNTLYYDQKFVLQWSQLDKHQDDTLCPHTSGSSWKGRAGTGNDGDSNDPDIGPGDNITLDSANPSANVGPACTASGQLPSTTAEPSPCKLLLPLVRNSGIDDVATVQAIACFEVLGDLGGTMNWHGILRPNNQCPPYGTYNNTGWTWASTQGEAGKIGLTN